MRECIFFTGASGFIGRRLLHSLVQSQSDAHFILLVQNKFLPVMESHVERLRSLFPTTRLEIWEGDLVDVNLGVGSELFDWLCANVTQVVHLAAVYDLSISREIAFKINVEGTSNVLKVCERAFVSLLYFSTCYVSGWREGEVLESDLSNESGFKNYYEESKYVAEVLVREKCLERAVIIRPGIVCGDSSTGETEKFDGLYFLFEQIEKLKTLPLPIPSISDIKVPVNFVPVDYVVKASAYLWEQRSKNFGKTFQLVEPTQPRGDRVYAWVCELIARKSPRVALPLSCIRMLFKIPFLKQYSTLPDTTLPYFCHPVRYLDTNTQNALKLSGIACPSLKDSLSVMYDYFRSQKDRQHFKAKY